MLQLLQELGRWPHLFEVGQLVARGVVAGLAVGPREADGAARAVGAATGPQKPEAQTMGDSMNMLELHSKLVALESQQ